MDKPKRKFNIGDVVKTNDGKLGKIIGHEWGLNRNTFNPQYKCYNEWVYLVQLKGNTIITVRAEYPESALENVMNSGDMF